MSKEHIKLQEYGNEIAGCSTCANKNIECALSGPAFHPTGSRGGFLTRALHLLIWLPHVLLLYVDNYFSFKRLKHVLVQECLLHRLVSKRLLDNCLVFCSGYCMGSQL